MHSSCQAWAIEPQTGEPNRWETGLAQAQPELPDDRFNGPKKVLYFHTIMLYSADHLPMKARLDDDLQATVLLLEQKYPFDTCTDHPRKRCFHYRVTNKHFDLTHPWLLVWAAAIVCLLFLNVSLAHQYICRDGRRPQWSESQSHRTCSRTCTLWRCRKCLVLLCHQQLKAH